MNSRYFRLPKEKNKDVKEEKQLGNAQSISPHLY